MCINVNLEPHPALRKGPQASPIIRRTARLALLAAAALWFGGCTTSDFGASSERRAEALATDGQFIEAAGIYIGLAAGASGERRDLLTLLAVEQWLLAGDGRRAENALRQVATPADGELLWLWSADAAALALWQGNPDRAMELLEPLARQPLPADHRARVEALRADAWFQKGEPLRAVSLYVQRENWLDDPRAIERNRRRLWVGLSISDVRSLRTAAEVSTDPMLRGWLTLAALANSTGQQGIGWGSGVLRWQEEFANHPASVILADLSLPEIELLNYPRQIALLLPLSGSNEAAGNAIKNGFLGAFYAAVSGTDQQVRLYDVNAEGGVSGAYSSAVADGAEFAVGPLLRRNVNELAAELLVTVPILALNYLPDEATAPPGFFQYALAPEDEATSAAQRAIDDERQRAVALVPANDWGRRVLGSFATEFEGLGGTLVDYRSYEPDNQDFSFEIENLMAIADSVRRYERLRANLEGPLQFDPRRRQDIDLVFLAADSRSGRLIKSQLKFHYSGDLPVYSTSFIYSMDGRSDDDLEGVMFADAPWVVAPPAWIADFPALYDEYFPAERRLARLHAMGYDAYHLVGELFKMREGSMGNMTGATGELFLTSDGRIHRRLAWARFEQGQPVSIPDHRRFDDSEDRVLPGENFDESGEWPEPSGSE
jgi:outer membrane PBP1 activator LpoA protein